MIIITSVLHFFAVMWGTEVRVWTWLLSSWLLGPFAAALVTCPLAATVTWRALQRRSGKRPR